MKFDEDFRDGARQAFVHREALARPVAGRAEPLELVDDRAAGFGLPLPNALDEGFASHLAARRLLPFRKLALDDHLRGDAGVVGAGLPQHVFAAHPLEPARMSWSVLLSACPIWSEPVTFGGGMTIEKGFAFARSSRPARKACAASQAAEMRASTAAGSKVLSIRSAQPWRGEARRVGGSTKAESGEGRLSAPFIGFGLREGRLPPQAEEGRLPSPCGACLTPRGSARAPSATARVRSRRPAGSRGR